MIPPPPACNWVGVCEVCSFSDTRWDSSSELQSFTAYSNVRPLTLTSNVTWTNISVTLPLRDSLVIVEAGCNSRSTHVTCWACHRLQCLGSNRSGFGHYWGWSQRLKLIRLGTTMVLHHTNVRFRGYSIFCLFQTYAVGGDRLRPVGGVRLRPGGEVTL